MKIHTVLKRCKVQLMIIILCVMVVGCGAENDTVSSGDDVSDSSTVPITETKVSEEENEEIETSVATEESNVELDIIFSTVEYNTVDYQESFDVENMVTFSDGQDIYITESGIYEFSGTYEESTIVVNVDKDEDKGIVYLVLNNTTITSENDTPIYIMEAKDVVILLVEGTSNFINQGEIATDDEEFPSGAIYSKADTVIAGTGSLEITTLYNDGINGRDDLIIENATLNLTAAGDGIVAKDYLAFSNVAIEITAGGDGIKSTNDEESDKGNFIIQSGVFSIEAQKDAISASNTLQIDDGEFELYSGGGFVEILNSITVGEGSGNTIQPSSQLEYSMKGLKSYNMILNGGTFNISAYEDGIHANNELEINGGTFTIYSGDDAVHADNTMVINDGTIGIGVGYEGIEADILIINGGNIYVAVLDDAINGGSSDGYLEINGGTIYLYSLGDGLDANGDLTITGGEFIFEIDSIYSGGDSEVDASGTLSITGGTFMDVDGNEIDPTSFSGSGMSSGSSRRR